ncbi:MAG: hypothetical protein ABI779_04695, partial [Acidobacteriota bacterium]
MDKLDHQFRVSLLQSGLVFAALCGMVLGALEWLRDVAADDSSGDSPQRHRAAWPQPKERRRLAGWLCGVLA